MSKTLRHPALATLVTGLALGCERHWQRVGVRIVGSWITTCAILYLTWVFVSR